MTYSEAITVLFGVHNGLPNNYALKASFFTAIGNLNSEEGGGSDSDLQVCDQVFDAYPSPSFQTALEVISETVNPDKAYPTKKIY